MINFTVIVNFFVPIYLKLNLGHINVLEYYHF